MKSTPRLSNLYILWLQSNQHEFSDCRFFSVVVLMWREGRDVILGEMLSTLLIPFYFTHPFPSPRSAPLSVKSNLTVENFLADKLSANKLTLFPLQTKVAINSTILEA